MSFSEFQYSNRKNIAAGETWTKETNVTSINLTDALEQGTVLEVKISNPQGRYDSRYSAYQRVRLMDRPSNTVIFLGRVSDMINNQRTQMLTLQCQDYSIDLNQSSVPSKILYGNRRSDIVADVISGGVEVGKTKGYSASQQDYIVDTTKTFDSSYIGRVVKVAGMGPGRIASSSGTSGSVIVTDTQGTATTTGPFDGSYDERVIRKVAFQANVTANTTGYKRILWEGTVESVTDSRTLVTSTGGINSTASGGADYTSAGPSWSAGDTWEIVGYEGKIVAVVDKNTIQVENVGATTQSDSGYKDTNFYWWGTTNTFTANAGGIEYTIDSAENGVFQATSGQAHTSDKSIDYKSMIEASPYLEYVQRSYGQGSSGSEGARDSILRLARDEVWEVPQVMFFSGHMGEQTGVNKNQWHLMTAEANTGYDLMYKPTMAKLPLQNPVKYNSVMVRVDHDHDHSSAVTNTTVTFKNPSGGATVALASGTFDPDNREKNRIQVGNEERRVTYFPSNRQYVRIDKPFSKSYTASSDVHVATGYHGGGEELVENGSFTSTFGAWVEVIGTNTISNNTASSAAAASNNSAISQHISGFTAGQRYRFTFDIVSVTNSTAVYAAIGSTQYPSAGYNDAANPSSITAGIDQTVDFTADADAASDGLFINLVNINGSGSTATVVWDNISVHELNHDSRLYIGSPRIFNAIQFDMEGSTDLYHSMELEFWGRNRSDDANFGWHRIEGYSVDAAQLEAPGSSGNVADTFISNPEGGATDGINRGIDNFNQSGIVKWWDISSPTTATWAGHSMSRPNIDWNHWAKRNLVDEEPVANDIAYRINTVSTDKHNNSLRGGTQLTSLTDPELANLYWVRVSVPRNENSADIVDSQSPGLIRNIRILDGRNSATSSDTHYDDFDSTPRNYPFARWDSRLESPRFFNVVGKSDTTANPQTWTDYTKAVTSRTSANIMPAFDANFDSAGKYVYFGSDYKFSGIEFNLSSALSSHLGVVYEFWNGLHWVGIQDLNNFGFNALTGVARWDMDTIDAIESQGADYSSNYSKHKWVKRDLRAANGDWGGYNYQSGGSVKNPHKPPNSSGVIQVGDDSGSDYPGGVGNIANISVPHHHLYWMRMHTVESMSETLSFLTIRTFSKASLKYFERGTEPWNFNITGTDATGDGTTFGAGRHDFRDANGQFVVSGADKMWVKNTSSPDTSNSVANLVSASRVGLQPALKRGGIASSALTTQTETTANLTSDLTDRMYLSAGLFINGYAPTDYQGRDGSNYLLYQDKRAGVKTYDVYGGGTSTRDNWHGASFKYGVAKSDAVTPIYRYQISEVPSSMVTRVTVNGKNPITATAIDTASESTYGIKQERIAYDRTILTVTEAQASADSYLAAYKPLSTQTAKKLLLEVYDYPVYKYNSATTASVDRDIPHVVRAGDMIQVTIEDGAYSITNEPFLVTNLTYEDKNTLTKITCTQGIFPATTETGTPWSANYRLAKEARDSAQQLATPSATAVQEVIMATTNDTTSKDPVIATIIPKVEDKPGEQTVVNVVEVVTEGNATKPLPFEEELGLLSPEDLGKYFEDYLGFGWGFSSSQSHNHGGATTLGGTHEDAVIANLDSSDTMTMGNVIVIPEAHSFIAERGGFVPVKDWVGKTVVDSNGLKYTIKSIQGKRTAILDGARVWTQSDSITILQKSSVLKSKSTPNAKGTYIFNVDTGTFELNTPNQLSRVADTDNPLWTQMFGGFVGSKNTNSSGLLVIDLNADHGLEQYLTHKPIVTLTVDPSDMTGGQGALPYRMAYAVVDSFTNASDVVSIAQTGTAGSSSGKGTGSNTTFGKLSTQANNTSVSSFNASHVGSTVYKLDANNQIVGSGTVQSVVTSGSNPPANTIAYTSGVSTHPNPTSVWATGERYAVNGQISRIRVQVYMPQLSLATATSAATQSLLLSNSGTVYTSEKTDPATAQEVLFARAVDAVIGVSYQIVIPPNPLNNRPFTGVNGNNG